MTALVERQMWHPLGRGAGSLFGEQSRVIFRECRSLTRANVMKQAARPDAGDAAPRNQITTNPTDYQPIKQLYLIQFNTAAEYVLRNAR
jgi:hypothetical protein